MSLRNRAVDNRPLGWLAVLLMLTASAAFAGDTVTVTPPGQDTMTQAQISEFKKDDRALIKENNWEGVVCLQVTTARQRRFDNNGDGYLDKIELNNYLMQYRR